MKVVCVLSGGMDSTTLLYKLRAEGHEIKALSIYYGQKHVKELECAQNICIDLEIEHTMANLSAISKLVGNSALTGDIQIPEGHYTDENMKLTVVPNRNMILLSVAIGYAVSNDFDAVAYAAHGGDHAIYPDCRPLFLQKMREVSEIANYKPTGILAPYMDVSKAEIVRQGFQLGVPYQKTWSCYVGGERPCLRCGTCVERTEAFVLNGKQDPLLTIEEWEQAKSILEGVKK